MSKSISYLLDELRALDMSKRYSKSYLHHLFNTREILGLRIASSHNLHFYIQLMSTMRLEIKNGTFSTWSKKFLTRYESK